MICKAKTAFAMLAAASRERLTKRRVETALPIPARRVRFQELLLMFAQLYPLFQCKFGVPKQQAYSTELSRSDNLFERCCVCCAECVY